MSNLTVAGKAPAHALLSASAAHRWLVCTPSARLEETLPEEPSVYAEEGTLAHDIAALKMRNYFVVPMAKTKDHDKALRALQTHRLYQDEMLHRTDAYLEYAKSVSFAHDYRPHVAVEVRVDYSRYAPEGFGTADCIIVGGQEIHVIDFKYGKGVPVSAERNPQMMLYALGALTKYEMLYGIEVVKMTIFQPRLDSVSTWEISAQGLRQWGADIKRSAQLAFEGGGNFEAGDHCRFCRAKATCRARAEYYLSLDGFQKVMPPLVSNTEVGEILRKALALQTWVEDLKTYALAECLEGREVTGWKAVEGRAIRRWSDGDAAFAALLDSGIDEAMLYEKRPITLAATEKLLTKPKFTKLVGSFVETPPGKPALAQASDKRPAITKPRAEDDFEAIAPNQ